MRFISADYIFPISSAPIKNGVVVADDDGTIIEILSPNNFTPRPPPFILETFRGIICPGFINAHCHLELSHLKGKLTPGKGLPHFIKEIAMNRKASEHEIKEAIVRTEDEMIAAGIVAVGDISNFNHSFEQKKKGRLRYHTFIEIFDLVPERAEEEFRKGLNLVKQFHETGRSTSEVQSSVSITPHAPYTVTPAILKLINDFASAHDALISIHNQETESENEMFFKRKGKLFETLTSFGDYYSAWKETGLSSIETTLVHLPKCNKTQLVHNTYTTADDITWAHLYSMLVWWCTCPNANLFIENKLPDYKFFADAGCRMTVGTDSYASNWSLSILDELKTISKYSPFIKLETLLRWSTWNGAEFLGFDKELGSIEKGKKPGLNLITNVDPERLRLTEDSEVRKIL
jgi:cytosine/adenosine deaminase-related metal-dependent hydrolase